MLGYVYGRGHALNTNQDLGVKVATPIGTFVGQLLFGWLADIVGRKRMCKSLALITLHFCDLLLISISQMASSL
jgi:MFS family permease